MTDGPFRGGKVHVLAERCGTCIFRPGNPMMLRQGRVAGMVREALDADSAITCHSTLYGTDVGPAVCRGFFDGPGRHVSPLQIAGRLDMIEFDPVPEH